MGCVRVHEISIVAGYLSKAGGFILLFGLQVASSPGDTALPGQQVLDANSRPACTVPFDRMQTNQPRAHLHLSCGTSLQTHGSQPTTQGLPWAMRDSPCPAEPPEVTRPVGPQPAHHAAPGLSTETTTKPLAKRAPRVLCLLTDPGASPLGPGWHGRSLFRGPEASQLLDDGGLFSVCWPCHA